MKLEYLRQWRKTGRKLPNAFQNRQYLDPLRTRISRLEFPLLFKKLTTQTRKTGIVPPADSLVYTSAVRLTPRKQSDLVRLYGGAESQTGICQLTLRFIPTCFSCCRLPTSTQRGLYL